MKKLHPFVAANNSLRKKQERSQVPSFCRPGGYTERYFLRVKAGLPVFPFEKSFRPAVAKPQQDESQSTTN